MKTYEGMFLLDAGQSDFEAAAAPVREILGRVDAEVLSLKPWDERRLAYDIAGRKRGLYILTYFKAEPGSITTIQHDVQLDERILRAMVLSADHAGEEMIHAETPATQASARRAARKESEEKAERRKSQAEGESAPAEAGAAKPDQPEQAAATEAPAGEAASPPPEKAEGQAQEK